MMQRVSSSSNAERECLTSRHAHVGPHLEPGVDVDDGAPDHVAGKVSRDELHCGGQVVSGLVVLLISVICVCQKRYRMTLNAAGANW